MSDLTNVQPPKGNYSQRLYDSSLSRVSSTQQGHIFITPTAKRTSVFSKDLDTQDSEIVRVHLSDVTNVQTSTRVYRQVLTPTNNENSWNRGTGMENTQDRHSEINRNLLHDFVDASQLQNQVPPQLQGNTINANTMFWFA
nr:hypothetical protein Iba_chr09cCG2100 [Ipomoea batatas]GMD41338.1 hypothetical protein Iba_chr10aCG18080 [Ipomoea batatas]